MQFNKYNRYSLNYDINSMSKIDEVDSCIQDVRNMNIYEDIRSYLTERFGEFSGDKWVDFPDLHKELFLRIEDDKIEVCALKNNNQYFGQGWKLITD